VRVPDELVNTRIKCPVCGELLSTDAARPDEEPPKQPDPAPVERSKTASDSSAKSPKPAKSELIYEKQKASTASEEPRTASNFHANGGFLFAGLPMPSFFNESSVTLLPERVRIKSSGPFGTRRLDLRLPDITSAETRRCPAWYLLVPGFLLLAAQGVGLLFLLAFLFARHSYLILRCGNATVAVRFKGDDTDACAIGDAILQAAQTATGRLR
jgi:hypothetical protein